MGIKLGPDGDAKQIEPARAASLPWIRVAGSYFATEEGDPWTPIGQNDAISWPELNGLFLRRDVAAVEAHLRWLKESGVTCLRLMLEYAQFRHRYFERPQGRFVPAMVLLWDDLFRLCEKYGLRILLTPFDTFWQWLRWDRHPYNRKNGGALDHPSRFLVCPDTRRAIKARLEFAVRRWGGSGALFAWDLWNEIHPEQAEGSADNFNAFIQDLSGFVRRLETSLYGRSHPQTVSLFGPELRWRQHMPLPEPIFRHPDLDFASLHVYEEGTIDDPRDTVAPALGMGRIVGRALGEIRDGRPFLDSEHGPIHSFKDKKITLPEPFDDEYFRHMQWAHLAAGGAGGGMRWPNRSPHVLTAGMRRAQRSLADFLPLIDWPSFRRVHLGDAVRVSNPGIAAVACGDDAQAVVWLARTDTVGKNGMLRADAPAVPVTLELPGLAAGKYRIVGWDTAHGKPNAEWQTQSDGRLRLDVPPFSADLAIAVRRH
jgi:mannan endo-1,4-beta-mannosidase